MDVADWLRGLGLEQYAPAFRDNDIDEQVLRRLTAEDLISFGVNSVGHRRKLLDAVAALEAPIPAVETPAFRGRPLQADAERRQLTVMFSDLVGSTALAASLDPEDLREVIAAYHRAVARVVKSFDGFVAQYMGDGVLAYFGYPQAHEDDAERAVRSGLAVVETVAELDSGHEVSLRTRVGIATGLVVAEALEMAERTGERWPEAELHRLRSEWLTDHCGEEAEAARSFERSLAVARQQGAKMWELRAAASLARLCRDQRRHAEGRELLASVYSRFTEGFDTPDLREAKALLDELA